MRTLLRAVAAETIKLRSLRSTALTLAVAGLLGVGVGFTATASTVSDTDRADFDAVGQALGGLTFAQLAFAAIGVLVISGEYATGAIRTTMTAIPRRCTGFAAKALVLTTVTLIAGEALAFAAFGVGQYNLARQHLAVGLDGHGVLRAVVSAGLYLWVVAMVGFGIGALLRHTAAALAAVFAVVFLAWPVARALESWTTVPDRLLLANAADVLAQVSAHPAVPDRVPSLAMAYAVLAGYLVVALGLGLWRMTRDA